ncbi:MAG: M56 family metallopeptidase [Longimicrobiales bacterium]
MIAAWMLYCMTLGVLLAVAGLLAERAACSLGATTRRVWALALTGALALPVAGVVVRGGDLPEEILFEETARAVSPGMALVVESVDALSVLDGLLLDAWGVASGMMALGLLGVMGLTAFQGRGWSRESVDGVDVLISDDVGPAVVGFVRCHVVLPRWALEAAPGERTIMIRHELEHLAARDPRLLLFGMAAAVAMPWNLPVWYMLRRLRLAVEVDCDARVLGSGELDVGAYGTLLLSVGRRRAASYPTAAFSRPRSTLWHRIERMTRTPAPGHRWRAAGLAGAVVLALAAAWFVPQPVRAADASLLFLPCPEHLAPTPGDTD